MHIYEIKLHFMTLPEPESAADFGQLKIVWRDTTFCAATAPEN
jgi:hypothetical protein